MGNSGKPPTPGGKSNDAEERALAARLVPPTPLEQLTEWRAKVAARLAKSAASTRAPPKGPPKKRR